MHGTHMHHNHTRKRRARVARRMMMKRRMGMMAAMGRGPWTDEERGESWGPTNEEKLRWLEEYQRDLEQETANVVTRITDLKAKAETPTDA